MVDVTSSIVGTSASLSSIISIDMDNDDDVSSMVSNVDSNSIACIDMDDDDVSTCAISLLLDPRRRRLGV